MIGKVLVLNILGFSKLLFVSSTLSPPRWVYDRINLFMGLTNLYFVQFRKDAWASESFGPMGSLSILCRNIVNVDLKYFYLFKYFCGAQLASLQCRWALLRDNASPSALSPSFFFFFLFYKPYGIYIFPLIFPFLLRNFILSFLLNILPSYTALSLEPFWLPVLCIDASLAARPGHINSEL